MHINILNDIYTNGYTDYILNIVTIVAIMSGIYVLTIKNPIISILFLIGLFASIAIYLIFLNMTFIGLAYLIVYIGAVSILFLFILMLIDIRLSELQSNTINSIPLATFMLISLIYTINQILSYNFSNSSDYAESPNIYRVIKDLFEKKSENNALFVTSNNWETNIIEIDHINSIGSILYTSHNLWLIMTSYILLLAMVGAIVITINKKLNKEISLTVELSFYTRKVKGSNPLFLKWIILYF